MLLWGGGGGGRGVRLCVVGVGEGGGWSMWMGRGVSLCVPRHTVLVCTRHATRSACFTPSLVCAHHTVFSVCVRLLGLYVSHHL